MEACKRGEGRSKHESKQGTGIKYLKSGKHKRKQVARKHESKREA